MDVFTTDNFIDGAAYLLLPTDFTEFSHLVPQSGLRMKLKAATDKLVETGPYLPNNVSVSLYVANVSDCP